ncbi:MAG: hypothetical protein AB3A66_01795 [Nodularia sp. CChRGM 3473]
MIAVTDSIEQNSVKQNFTNKLFQTSFDVLESSFNLLDEIEIDDLESFMATEFIQGLPSDTEMNAW